LFLYEIIMKNKILIVDDELSIRTSLASILEDEDYEVWTAKDGEDTLQLLKTRQPDLVLLDIWMPKMDGLEVLERIKATYPKLEVVMISGHGNVETAVKATKLGAYDFIEKPLSLEKTLLVVQHAMDKQRLEKENETLRSKTDDEYEMIGTSRPMQELKRQIELVAPSDGRVFIFGENGTGKELLARAIHSRSLRSHGPFIAVNCAAIPEELIESELFGHEKGSFTGATATRIGRFEQAHQGTLFLDEIGDMSLKTQAKVLRVIEDQAFERVGGSQKITSDVRIIAASNKNMELEIREGHFREDLFYRLHVIPFTMPPLTERTEDIPILIDHFLRQLCVKNGRRLKRISPEAMKILINYAWPGNVRELKNIIERLVIMEPGNEIAETDIPLPVHHDLSAAEKLGSLKAARNDFEREFLLRKLRENKGNITQTARELKIERSHFHRKLKSYGISTKDLD